MNEHNILGAILAGGQSKRMGQDKLFLELNNRKLIEYTIDKVKKYLKNVIIIKFLKYFFTLSIVYSIRTLLLSLRKSLSFPILSDFPPARMTPSILCSLIKRIINVMENTIKINDR